MNKSNLSRIMWGIILILMAVGLVMYKMGSPVLSFLPEIGLWQLLIGLALVAILINALCKLSFGGILFSLAFLGIVFDHELGIEDLVPWTILLVALLGTIALNLLFGKAVKRHFFHTHIDHHEKSNWTSETVDINDEDAIYENVRFGGSTKYVHSEDFKYATFNCSFGGLEIYLDKAKVPSGKATVEIHSNFSGVELYIPRDWNVVNKISSMFGAVDTKGSGNADSGVTITLVGDNHFGAIDIKRI